MKLNPKPIKIILADDHTVVREALADLLQKQEILQVVATAGNGKDLIHLVNTYTPHLVITDISMPLLNGIEATKKIIELHPDIGVIALTMYDETHLLIDIVNAGARGYLLKNTEPQELYKAIDVVSEGGTFYTREVADKLVSLAARTRFRSQMNGGPLFTPVEIEIIKLIFEQLSSKEIGERLNLKKRTVENYREKIQRKIGAKNMIGIVLYAIKNKLVEIR